MASFSLRARRRILAALTAVIVIGCTDVSRPAASSVPVAHVVDGDTIVVRVAGKTERVRLIGIDTPESDHPNPMVRSFAAEATAFLRRLLDGRSVTLEAEVQRDDRDKHGRLLRYVVLDDGRSLNELILSEGYGFAYTRFPFKKMKRFRQLEREAREAGRGLWGSDDPSAFRRTRTTGNGR